MFILTPQISTGNVATVLDKYDSTLLNNNAKMPLGMKFYDASDPFKAYRYVRYNSTANAATQATPSVVWWTDNTFTTVTSTVSEAFGGATNARAMAAGIWPGSSASYTAAQLNGNFIIIQVAGFLAAMNSPASVAIGDALLATQTDWTTTGGLSRVAANTAPTNRVVAWALSAVSSNKYDGFIVLEN